MNDTSFYVATNRGRINESVRKLAIDQYEYNYNQYLPKDIDSKIIDLGCSDGIAMEWLSKQGYRNLVGVDSDSKGIAVARERLSPELSDESLMVSDALEYVKTIDDNSVDMFVMLNVVEHFPKDVLMSLMIEIRRCLATNGVFLAQTGNWENPFNIGLFTRDFTHHIMFTKNSLKQLMVMSGFVRESVSVSAVKYKKCIRSIPYLIITPVVEIIVRLIARSMRCRITELAPLIYVIARKESV